MWDTWVWSLDLENPLEEVMATHSSILPGESPWTEDPGGLQSMGLQRVRHDWATFTFTVTPGMRCGHTVMDAHLSTGRPLMVTVLKSSLIWEGSANSTVLLLGESPVTIGSVEEDNLSRKKRVFTFFFVVLAKINSLILYIYGTSTLPCRGWYWFFLQEL